MITCCESIIGHGDLEVSPQQPETLEDGWKSFLHISGKALKRNGRFCTTFALSFLVHLCLVPKVCLSKGQGWRLQRRLMERCLKAG